MPRIYKEILQIGKKKKKNEQMTLLDTFQKREWK